MTGKGPLLLFALALLLGGLTWLLLPASPGTPQVEAAQRDQGSATPELPETPEPKAHNSPPPRRVQAPEHSTQRREEKQERHRMPFFVMTDRKALLDLKSREARPLPPPRQLRRKQNLATILQLPEQGPRALYLEQWIKEKTRAEREFLAGGRKAQGTTAERAEAFNQLVRRRTEELRRELGERLALQVTNRVPLFRMDRTTGEIHRVDLYGNRRKEREVPDE